MDRLNIWSLQAQRRARSQRSLEHRKRYLGKKLSLYSEGLRNRALLQREVLPHRLEDTIILACQTTRNTFTRTYAKAVAGITGVFAFLNVTSDWRASPVRLVSGLKFAKFNRVIMNWR